MTKVNKEELDMQQTAQNNVTTLALPQNEKKRLMQAEVNLDLFNAVQKEMTRKDLKIRQVMEWGLKAFLASSNPAAAAKLGIKTDT